jgi:hypothetical protein
MNRLYGILSASIPPPGRDWIDAHWAEYSSIADRRLRRRWARGLAPIAVHAIVTQLWRHPRSFVGGSLARAAVTIAAGANLALGLGLLVLFAKQNQLGPAMLAFASVLIVLAVLSAVAVSSRQQSRPVMRPLFATIAVAGLAAIIVGTSLTIGAADPEYGPLAVALAVSSHSALAALATGRPEAPPPPPDPT